MYLYIYIYIYIYIYKTLITYLLYTFIYAPSGLLSVGIDTFFVLFRCLRMRLHCLIHEFDEILHDTILSQLHLLEVASNVIVQLRPGALEILLSHELLHRAPCSLMTRQASRQFRGCGSPLDERVEK